MRNYATQMDAAKHGIITPEMKAVAEQEYRAEEIRDLVARSKVVICASRAPEQEDSCSMCGKFCAVRSMNKALAGEYIDIL